MLDQRYPSPATAAGPRLVAADALETRVREIFAGAGSLPREAALIARHLVEANLRGHDSHGVGVVASYLVAAREGRLGLNRTLGVLTDRGPFLLCDGGQGAGQVMAHDAVARAIERARAEGACVLGLRNSYHIGRIGHWAEQCAAAGFVSLHFVNVPGAPVVAPFGGSRARLGTNPFAAGFPRAGAEPVVVDFATSRYAVGKVRVARDSGATLPPGVLLDADGRPTLDPAAMFASPPGALLPFGEHKGFGLALVCEIMAGLMTGGPAQEGVRLDETVVNSMFSLVVSPDLFSTLATFERGLDALAAWVASEPEAGVRLPGEPERETRARRIARGVPLDAATAAHLDAACAEHGLAPLAGLDP